LRRDGDAEVAGEIDKLLAGGARVLQPAEEEGLNKLGAREGALALNEAAGARGLVGNLSQNVLKRVCKPWYAAHRKAPLADGVSQPHHAKSELSLSSLN
jgi:hypothetical protein